MLYESKKEEMTKKELFKRDFDAKEGKATTLVVCIQLPPDAETQNGPIEMIINTMSLNTKMAYYMSAYDDDLRMIRNPIIRIVNWNID